MHCLELVPRFPPGPADLPAQQLSRQAEAAQDHADVTRPLDEK
jgi:hypothetical protein